MFNNNMLKNILILLAVSIIGIATFIIFSKPKVDTQKANTSDQVPLPTRQSLISTFFALINEKRIPAAIDMMDKKLVGDDAARQAWGVQFNSLKSIVVKKIEPSMKEEWTTQKETFKVNVNLEVSKEAVDAPIPNYGWENEDNMRWITLEKNENNIWKISSIATGP